MEFNVSKRLSFGAWFIEAWPLSLYTIYSNGTIPSIIDHSWSNNLTKHISTSIFNTDSDHEILLTIVNAKRRVHVAETTNGMDLSWFNGQDYVIDLLGQNSTSIYRHTGPNLILDDMINKLTSPLDTHAQN